MPLGYATVKIVGIWKNLANLAEKPPAPANVVFIHPPLYEDRPAGTRCSAGILAPAPNSGTTLLAAALAGADRIYLANGTRFRPGDLLKLLGNDPDREEVMSVESAEQTSADDPSTWITLSRPLGLAHRVGADIQKVRPHWEAQGTTFLLNGDRGQSTVFIDAPRRFKASEYLRIEASGKVAEEVHRLKFYETKSDREGFYQLPPLQRVGQVQLESERESRKLAVRFQPDFSLPRNQVDFVFKDSQIPESAEDNHA